MPDVRTLDALEEAVAREVLARSCGVEAWVEGMLARRPFGTADALFAAADAVWRGLAEEDRRETFRFHPRIGDVAGTTRVSHSSATAAGPVRRRLRRAADPVVDVGLPRLPPGSVPLLAVDGHASPSQRREVRNPSPRRRFAATAAWSEGEQAGVRAADEEVLARLAEGNRRYEERFGHIFLVCATGKSAAEMLAILEERLGNDRDAEVAVAMAEQGKITRLRLEKWLKEQG